MPARKTYFVVITGLSGSGKSTALRALEDLGFYALDNLPVQLLRAFVDLWTQGKWHYDKAALVMDVRAPDFLSTFPALLDELVAQGLHMELLFLDCSDEVLIRRFSQTRRQHPMARASDASPAQGVARERLSLQDLRERAHQVMDTSHYNVHELRRELWSIFKEMAPSFQFHINFLTFGYKFGVPAESDLLFDVRFLRNPHFQPDLTELDGRDQRVVDFIFREGPGDTFLNKIKELLNFLLPYYRQEGKSHLTVAVGCTGGKHRSVAVAQWLARQFEGNKYVVTLRHRDLDRG